MLSAVREDLGQLKYVTMCVREAMRLHGPVPIIQRELTKPFNLDGVLLPPGCTVEVPIYSVHHNPQVWGEDHMVLIWKNGGVERDLCCCVLCQYAIYRQLLL